MEKQYPELRMSENGRFWKRVSLSKEGSSPQLSS